MPIESHFTYHRPGLLPEAREPVRRYAPQIEAGTLSLLVGPKAERDSMLELTARLAALGPVRVLDGGNSFNALRVARLLRRQTAKLNEALNRITVARAFTCYQVVTLFESTPSAPSPQLVLDLLATFYDENVTLRESRRLLGRVLFHIKRLQDIAPVVVSVRPPPQPERAGLLDLLMKAADQTLMKEEEVWT